MGGSAAGRPFPLARPTVTNLTNVTLCLGDRRLVFDNLFGVAIMRGFLCRLWADQWAATAIEYTLIVGLISVAGIGVFGTLGSKVLNMLGNVIP
jgi:Flp pilus assembly pilin Flp